MSPQSSFEFNEFVPPELYKRWFNIISKNEKQLYVCVIQNENQVRTVYLEPPRNKDGNIDGFIRVFFDLPHLKRYGGQVAITEGIHPDMVLRWELTFGELFEYIRTMTQRNLAAGKPGVMAIASSIHGEKFVEIDMIWTSDKNVVV